MHDRWLVDQGRGAKAVATSAAGTFVRQVTRSLLAALALTGCGANWQPVSAAQPEAIDARTVLEFHAGENVVRLHGVRFERDSVIGIPWLEHLNCDTCRVRYARSDMTQARTGDPGRPAWGLVLPVVAVFSLFELLHILVCGGVGQCT